MNINEVLGAWRSPWQRAYVELMIGSIRRECLDHLIVFDEKKTVLDVWRIRNYWIDATNCKESWSLNTSIYCGSQACETKTVSPLRSEEEFY